MEGYKFLHVEALDSNLIPGTSPDAIGNLALVKLEIPNDATVVYPVDKDYYCFSVFSDHFSDIDFYKMNNYVKSKKCRCSKAKIVEVIKYFSGESLSSAGYRYICDFLTEITCDSQPSDLIFKSMWNPNFIYKFDEYVKPDKLDEDICWECSNGIHFCRTIKDAIDYIETCGYTIMDKEE